MHQITRRGVLSAAAVLGITTGTVGAAVASPTLEEARWGRRRRPPRPPQPPTPPTPEPTPTPPPTATGGHLIGMSSPASVWSQRVAEVGPGLAARRIFADLGRGATSQIKLVEQAHAAGMLPVISYKVGGDAAGAASGRFNAVAEQAATRLASYGLPTAVTFWHEPHGDMTAAQYVAASKQLAADLQARRAAGRSDPERLAAGPPAGRRSRRSAPTSSSGSGTGSASTPTSPGPWSPGDAQAGGPDPRAREVPDESRPRPADGRGRVQRLQRRDHRGRRRGA